MTEDISDSACIVKKMARKFLAMRETDMEYVYLLVKDKPFMKEAYERAKRLRSERNKHLGG